MKRIDTTLVYTNKKHSKYRVFVESEHGDTLEARLFLPEKKGPIPGIVFNSGLKVNPNGGVSFLSRYLANQGYAVILPFYKGYPLDRVLAEDTLKAMEAFRYIYNLEQVDKGHVGMLGFSYGAMLSLASASHYLINRDVRYVISFAGPTDMFEMIEYAQTDPRANDFIRTIVSESFMGALMEQIGTMREKKVPDAMRALTLYREDFIGKLYMNHPSGQAFLNSFMKTLYSYNEFHDDLNIAAKILNSHEPEAIKKHIENLSYYTKSQFTLLSPKRNIDNIHARVMFLHGLKDPVIPIEQSESMHTLMKEKGKETEFIIIEGLDHILYPYDLRLLLSYLYVNGKDALGRVKNFIER